ncbi:hypothetical protein ACFXI8_27040 [Streptomyces niveus]
MNTEAPDDRADTECAMPGFVTCECDHVTRCQHPAVRVSPEGPKP